MSRGSARPWIVGTAAGAVLVAGLAVAGLQRADTATVLDEQTAIEAFRAEQSAAPQNTAPQNTAPQTASRTAAPQTAAGTGPNASPPVTAPVAAATSGPSSPARPTPAAVAAAPAPGRTSSPQAPSTPTPAGRTQAQRREVTPGVYPYATEGSEQVDALGGARHDYPASTTITYSRSGCGTVERWQPLKERVGESLECAGAAGSELRGSVQQREFFGRSETKRYTCDPGVPLLPRDPQPGRTTKGSCRSEDSMLALTTTVVALESLDVGGTAVPVVHLRVTGALTGSTRGRSDRELWLARSDGLLVQTVARTDTDADTEGGTVRYQESYRLRLTSLTPRT